MRQLRFEPLEDRRVLSTINWVNRGDGTDGFDDVFGANDDTARAVVDAALDDWEQVITNFNQLVFPALNNPNQLNITLSVDPSDPGFGGGAGGPASYDLLGHPLARRITISSGNDTDADGTGDGDGWYLDPNPSDHSEFLGTISNAFVGLATSGGPADNQFDLYSIVTIEMNHALGLTNFVDSGSPRWRTVNPYITNTGVADTIDNPGTLFTFVGPSVSALLTSNNGGPGGTDTGLPLHVALPQVGTPVPGFTGALDDGNASRSGFPRDLRTLPSNMSSLMLKDVYGYTLAAGGAEVFGTFYAVLDNSTGLLTVRGGTGSSSDDVVISRSGTELVVSVDVGSDVPGTGPTDAFVSRFPMAALTSIVINLAGGDDTVTVDFGGGNPIPAGGVTFNGSTGFDSMTLTGGGTFDTVTHTLNSNTAGNVNIDGSVVTYTGLDPITDNLDVVNRVFTFTTAGITGTLDESPGGLGADHSRLDSNASELVDFTTPGNSLVINLATGSSNSLTVIDLADDYNTPDNDINMGGSGDTVNFERTDGSVIAATPWDVFGGASSDTVNLSPTAQNLSNLFDNVRFFGSGGGADALNAFDNNRAVGDNYTVASNFLDRANWGDEADPGARYDSAVELVTLNTGTGSDTINVVGTSATALTTIRANAGNDTIFLSPFASDLDQLPGPIVIEGGGNTDTLNVRDQNDVGGNTYTVTNSTVARAGFGGVTYDAAVELLNIDAGTDGDTINVNSTSGSAATTIRGNGGADTLNINASALGGTNDFSGNANDDTFNVNLTTGAAISAPLNLHGNANDFGGGVGSRDVVSLNDQVGIAFSTTIAYTGNVGGSEIFSTFGSTLTVDTAETFDYNGTGPADALLVLGTPGNDLISVAPISSSRAIVFNGGLPFDGPPQNFATRLPGVSGGSTAPDLDLEGLDNATGLQIDDAGGSSDRLYIYGRSDAGLNDGNTNNPFGFGAGLLLPAVGAGNAFDTIAVSDTQTTVGTLVAVNYDSADFVQPNPATQPAVVINSGFEANPAATAGTDVADSIALTLSTAYRFQINGGNPDPAATGIVPPDGDQLNVPNPGTQIINIWSDGSSPPNVSVEFGGTGLLPFGFSSIENLALDANGGTVNLIGDNNDAAVVQNDYFKVRGRDVDNDSEGANEFALQLGGNWTPATGAVALSAPISINNATRINASGGSATGFDGDGNAIPEETNTGVDALDITAYADNTPLGWGIETYFNEGDPILDGGNGTVDLLIFNGVVGVSDDIVVQPSASQAGQVYSTNAATGTPIAVVNYVLNTNIIVNGQDGATGETDRLTLRGTNGTTPASAGTSGNETVDADFTRAGTAGNEWVRMTDSVGGAVLYNLEVATNFDVINIELLDGNDTVTLVASATVSADVDAGRGNDRLIATTSAVGVTFRGGEGDDNLTGGSGNDRLEGGDGSDGLDGREGSNVLLGGGGVDIISSDVDATDIIDGGEGTDEYSYRDTAGPFVVQPASFPFLAEVQVTSPGHFASLSGVERVNVLPPFLDATASVTVEDLSGTSVQSLGISRFHASTGSLTTNNFTGTITINGTGAADAISVADSSIFAGSTPTVFVPWGRIGIADLSPPFASLTINALGGNDTVTVDPAVSLGTTPIIVNGGQGNDVLSSPGTLNGDEGNDTLIGSSGNDAMTGGAGDDTIVGNGGTDTITDASGTDTILAVGTGGADTIATAIVGADLTVTINGVTTTYVAFAASGVERLLIPTGDGDDGITVVPVPGINTVVEADGPVASDTLNVTVTANARVTQGAVSTSGTVDQTGGGDIDFSGVEVLSINSATAASALTIRGTDDNDTIAVGLVGITAAWINDGTVVRYNAANGNFTGVTVQGRFGDDAFSVTPHAGVTITIQGGDPTASDTVLVNGTAGNDTINFSPTALDAATVQVNALGLVTLSTIESVSINGLGGTDALTHATPAGGDFVTYTPGAAPDAGTIATRGFGSGTGLVPLTFSHIGAGGSVTFASGGGREDFLELYGTNNSDTFNVNGPGGTVQILDAATGFATDLLNTGGITTLELRALDGDDTFNITGALSHAVFVDAGSPSASDVVNLSGATGAVTVNLAGTSTVTGYGATVTLIGVETLNANASTQNLTINATTGDDVLTVTPTDLNAASAVLTSSTPSIGSTPVINGSNIGTLSVSLVSGSDRLRVNGTQGGETITVTGALVTITGLETVNYTNVDDLQVFAQAGNDTIDVTPSANTTIFVDGGDPIGGTAGDAIVLHPPGAFTVEPGPENDEGGLNAAGVRRVSWDHVEAVTVSGGPGPGLILGTNGDDDITIIARDSSTHAGTDGVQDFTVTVNDGLEVLFINIATLFVDALAGDDDIVVRAPAPNQAEWDVDLNIVGGPAASVTGDQGDVLEFETPGGSNAVIFTPTGPESASLVLDQALNDSTISVVTSFIFDPAGINYISSPGGVENIVYDGVSLAGFDNLTINGTIINDTTNFDASTFLGNFRSLASPDFDFSLSGRITVVGNGGFDDVNITGSAGNDTVTSTATAISVSTPGSLAILTLGAGIDLVRLFTLDGNDNIDLDLQLLGLAKFIDSGAGNDTVNLLGVIIDPADPTIFGGDGDDVLIGSPNPDFIYGGRGNDIIVGGAGVDHEYGEDGNDIFGNATLTPNAVADDAGADFAFGGPGFDNFIWEPGDGADVNNGGEDAADIFRFFGDANANVFTLRQGGTPTHFNALIGALVIDNHGIEDVIVDGQGGADTFIVNDLYATEVVSINLNLSAADAGAIDPVTVNGREVADNVVMTTPAAGSVSIQGLRYNVNLSNAEATDTLTINGNSGDDSIKAEVGVETVVAIILNGNSGDDFLSADAIINGGTGDDFLEGGIGNDTINGNEGNDTIRGGGGTDVMSGDAGDDTFLLDYDGLVDNYFGGDGYDTLVIAGTPGNDVLTVNQTDVGITLQVTLNGVSEPTFLQGSGGVRTMERVRIEAGGGDDTVVVTHADVAGVDALVNSVLFDVDGGPANTRDRLSVQDNGTGDLVLYRQGTTFDSGSITVGPGNAEPLETVFTGFERVDPITPAGGAIRFFKLDTLEWNDNIANATHLGADETINVDPNIEPGLVSVPGFTDLPADNDFFRIVAEKTGTLDIQIYFTQLATVPSGRPGLPNAGNLDVELYDADGTLIVDGVAGGVTPEFGLNELGGIDSNERIRIPAVAGQTYYLRVLPNGTAINTYSITTINAAAPVPFGIELLDAPINTATNSVNGTPVGPTAGLNSDTGRSRFDDITFDNDPTILIRVPNVVIVAGAAFLDDVPANGAAPGSPFDEQILIPFRPADVALDAGGPGFRVAVFVTEIGTDNTAPRLAGYAQLETVARPGVFTFTFTPDYLAPDGSYFISAAVEMIDPTLPQQNQGFGELAQSLETIIDTTLPPASFGAPGVGNDGLILSDDCPTPLINLTNVARPTFWGRAEADTVINLYVDSNNSGAFDPADVFLGQTVATPFDGGDQYPNGYWEIESRIGLNDPSLILPIGLLPLDGPRLLFITAEDVAGNQTSPTTLVVATTPLLIVLDTQGPQVTDVDINNAGNPYDLFDPKPSTDGPTPLVNSIVISFQDLPPRIAGTLYSALEPGSVVPGNFRLIGDYNGIIPIQSIILVNPLPAAGSFATATVELVFFSPLPDDRFTLIVEDSVTDPLCNQLNGESNASEPQENPLFPSGDSSNGGDFVARFTIDTRPEVGTWGAGAAWIDTNGNTSFDSTNADFTNRDITYYMGYTSDNLFAGNFARLPGGVADGFDKLAAYGKVGTQWRVLVDVDNDGVITPGVDIAKVQTVPGINGLPVAGNFDGNAANGDEIGVFTGTRWYLDTDHDFDVSDAGGHVEIAWTENGYPVVGNYDGVAGDDLATYRDNTFFIDFGRNGIVDRTFRFGFPTPNNRPVSADMDQDGNDDLGLFVPNRSGVSPEEDAEWYILVSGGAPIVNRIHADPIDFVPVIDYKPVPFGNDVYIQYGDQFGLPILGNFDPPVTPGGSTSVNFPSTNPNNPLDVNNDGFVTPIDALLVINEINAHGSHALDSDGFHTAPFIDTDRDNVVSPHDVLLVINRLNAPPAPAGEGEADGASSAAAHDLLFSELGETAASAPSATDAGILSLLADDQVRAKRARQAE